MRRKFVKLVFSSSKEKIGGGEGRHSRRYLIANRAQNTRTRMTWHDLGPREGYLTRKGGDRYLPRFSLSFRAIFLFASHPSLRCPLSNKEQIISLLFASLSLSLIRFGGRPKSIHRVSPCSPLPLLLFFHSRLAQFSFLLFLFQVYLFSRKINFSKL